MHEDDNLDLVLQLFSQVDVEEIAVVERGKPDRLVGPREASEKIEAL